jgi:hypothetical protein
MFRNARHLGGVLQAGFSGTERELQEMLAPKRQKVEGQQ